MEGLQRKVNVLHHVVDGHATESTDPVGAVLEQRGAVVTNTSFGDASGNVGVEQVESRDLDLLTTDVVLCATTREAGQISLAKVEQVREYMDVPG